MPNIQSYPASNIQPNISNNLLFNADPMIVSFLHFYPISLFVYSLFETFQDAAKLLECIYIADQIRQAKDARAYISHLQSVVILITHKTYFHSYWFDSMLSPCKSLLFLFTTPFFLSVYHFSSRYPSTTAFINHLCNPLKWYLKL